MEYLCNIRAGWGSERSHNKRRSHTCLKTRSPVFLKALGISKATGFPGTASEASQVVFLSVHLTEI